MVQVWLWQTMGHHQAVLAPSPQNFLGRGWRAPLPRKWTEAFKIMLKNTKVKAILVNIFGGNHEVRHHCPLA
jgi:succinyl-CoA synthetase beta subunit